MGVAPKNRIDPPDTRGHLQINIHAVVGEHDHHLRAFLANLIHHFLHVVLLNAKGPVGHHVAWVSNRCVGKRLADDSNRNAVLLPDHIGLEDWITKVSGFDVLREKLNTAGKILFNNLFDPLGPESKFPVRTHHVDTKQLTGIHHVLTVCPQGCRRSLPGIAPIEQERIRSIRTHFLDQACKMSESPHLAVGLG